MECCTWKDNVRRDSVVVFYADFDARRRIISIDLKSRIFLGMAISSDFIL